MMVKSFSRLAVFLLVVVLVAVAGLMACTPTPTTIPQPVVTINSPPDVAELSADDVTVSISISDFNIVQKLGESPTSGEGHIHYYMDAEPPTTPGQPAVTGPGTYAATTETSHTWENVEPGTHTFSVQLVNNNHTPLQPPVIDKVTVTVIPSVTEEESRQMAEESVTIDLSARNVAFDKSQITVPPGAMVTIVFTNNDSGIPHNFALYETRTASKSIYVGEIITGVRTIEYTFVAPTAPGTYFFRCDVHPTTMKGDFIVGEQEASSGGNGSGSSAGY